MIQFCKTSADSDNAPDLYTVEFLNTINTSGMPPHILVPKVGAPIMLIRNIDQQAGLCNGSRLKISKLGKMIIEAVILHGPHKNEKFLFIEWI